MSDNTNQDDLGHHKGQWEQGVGGYIQFRVWTTPKEDTRRWHLPDPPHRVVPIIFLPGIMGSNLRMSKARQKELDRNSNQAWRPEDKLLAVDLGLATAAERQKNFDPATTEVDYYHYTTNADLFDPGGDETQASDARHQNVPDSFAEIPPMLTNAKPPPPEASMRDKMKTLERAAQKARWRGWSEVIYDGAYGDLLRTTEAYMNNILTTVAGQAQHLQQRWGGQGIAPQPAGSNKKDSGLQSVWSASKEQDKKAQQTQLQDLLRQAAASFGGDGNPLTEADLRRIAHCWYPVHAMGYPWLKSNGDNAREIAKRIRALMALYTERGLTCDKVILVTHSMGGLLGRALIHPRYGNLKDQVLGIYHSAMPTHGAAAAYKRIRCGFEKTGLPVIGDIIQKVLGDTGQKVTPVLANAPGGLELLPNEAYGQNWLKLVDQNNKPLMQWPSPQYTPVEKRYLRDWKNRPDMTQNLIRNKAPTANPQETIYTQPNQAWWRLINPKWVNPAEQRLIENGKEISWMNGVSDRIREAAKFHRNIANTFHPVTYASYCASHAQKSYDEVVWMVQPDTRYLDTATAGISARLTPATLADHGEPDTWTLIDEDGQGTLYVKTRIGRLELKLQAPTAPGDGTVPAARSADQVRGKKFVHGSGNDQNSYDHQNSYANPQVLASTLYAIVKIAGTATWWEK